MWYINKDDLISVIQEQLLTGSVAQSAEVAINDNTIVNDREAKTISLVISYISGLYNCDTIFNEAEPIRNDILVDIISAIVVYRCVRRNAARKVPEDCVKLYSDAIKDLEKIQSGVIRLVNCPERVTDDGSDPNPMYGNNTNDNFFI